MTIVGVMAESCAHCGEAVMTTDQDGAEGTYESAGIDLEHGRIGFAPHACLKAQPLPVVAPEPERRFADREEAAEWLALASGHPRYSAAGYGAAGLLDSPSNVEHAAAAATKRLMRDQGGLADVNEAVRVLS